MTRKKTKTRPSSASSARRSALPPCAPKPKRIRLDAEPFCARTRSYCNRDPVGSSYELGTRAPKWDSRMLLAVGILALFIFSKPAPTPKVPPELGPGDRLPPTPKPNPKDFMDPLPGMQANA